MTTSGQLRELREHNGTFCILTVVVVAKNSKRDSPGGPMVKTVFPMEGVRVQTLVKELRSHMSRSTAKKFKNK